MYAVRRNRIALFGAVIDGLNPRYSAAKYTTVISSDSKLWYGPALGLFVITQDCI